MNDLTEKWKKGELENGTYYVRLNHDSSTIDVFDCGVWWNNAWHEITEVLEEVPSYDEYQKLLSDQLAKNEGEEINAELERRLAMVKANGKYPDRISRLKSRVVALSEENDKLKEQLKECRSPINYALCLNLSEEEKKEFKNLLAKIKKALGEEQ